MSILNLKSKNPERGYGFLRGVLPEDPFWEIKNNDGLDYFIEESILLALNEAREIGDPLVETMAQAIDIDPQVQYVLDALYDIGATNRCSIAEMMIHTPVIINPHDGELLARADFLVNLEDYKSGLYFTGLHTATDWEISKYENMTYPDFSSYNDSSNLTEILTEGLYENTSYYIRAKFQSDQMHSLWSDKVLVHTGLVRYLLARTDPMTLFCTNVVDLKAILVGGRGSDHTLEWEQITDHPITWNFGETGSLYGQYVASNFEDVFWWLVVDRGTLYETRFQLNVYRGGIEFPDLTHKHKTIVAQGAAVPVIHTVKDFENGVNNYSKRKDNIFLFWENPQHYSMRLMKWRPSLYAWDTILDSPLISHYPISNGMYKLVIYDLDTESDVESKVCEIPGDDSLNINEFYEGSHKLISGNEYANLDIAGLTIFTKEVTDTTAKDTKCYVDTPYTNLNQLLLTIFGIGVQEDMGKEAKLFDTTIQNLTVVSLGHIVIG